MLSQSGGVDSSSVRVFRLAGGLCRCRMTRMTASLWRLEVETSVGASWEYFLWIGYDGGSFERDALKESQDILLKCSQRGDVGRWKRTTLRCERRQQVFDGARR